MSSIASSPGASSIPDPRRWRPSAAALRLCLLTLIVAATGRLEAAPFDSAVIEKVEGQALVRSGQGEWQPASAGDTLRSDAELGTGPESSVALQFPDKSVAVVRELSQIRVGSLLAQGDAVKIQLMLKVGEVEAQVEHKDGVKTDFSIATPVATASVRGTKIRYVRYTPAQGFLTWLREGRLLVQSPTGELLLTDGTRAQVEPDYEMLSEANLQRDASRLQLEPFGLTEPEVERIELNLEPRVFQEQSSPPQRAGGAGSTLLFRVVTQ